MKRKQTLEQLNLLRVKSDPRFRAELTAIADSLQELLNEAAKGGRARAEKLTDKRRSEIAQHAAKTRWMKTREGKKK